LARRFTLPSFLSVWRSRLLTIAAVGTLALATAVSASAAALPASAPLPARAATALTTTAGQSAAARTARQILLFDRARVLAGQREQRLAAARAPATKAAAPPTRHIKAVSPSGTPQQVAQQLLGQFGWSAGQFACLQPLWERESGWDVTAENPSSGAYGIPQALPGAQMASAGPDWQTNAATQIRWGLTYIQGRYGSPCGAWAHEGADGWY
jgi:hypothetical protein